LKLQIAAAICALLLFAQRFAQSKSANPRGFAFIYFYNCFVGSPDAQGSTFSKPQ